MLVSKMNNTAVIEHTYEQKTVFMLLVFLSSACIESQLSVFETIIPKQIATIN